MKVHFKYILLLGFIFIVTNLTAQNSSNLRTRLFDVGWSFKNNDISSGLEKINFDDSNCRKLNLTHDWSVEDLANQIPDSIVVSFINSSPSATFDGFIAGAIEIITK